MNERTRRVVFAYWVLFLACAFPLRGEDDQKKFEAFGAYSMLKVDDRIGPPALNEVSPPITDLGTYQGLISDFHRDIETMHGWNASVGMRLTRRFSLVGDVAGQYTPRFRSTFGGEGVTPQSRRVSSSHYSALFGPRFYLRNKSRLTPFAHGLVGISRMTLRVSGDWTVTSTVWGPDGMQEIQTRLRGTHAETTGLAGVVGGGLDLRLTNRLSLRLAQVDYLMARKNPRGEIRYVPEGASDPTGVTYRIARYLRDDLRFSYGVVFAF